MTITPTEPDSIKPDALKPDALTPAAMCALIEQRLRALFQRYADGLEVSPAMLYRTEGFIDAACCSGCLSRPQARELIACCYQQVLGEELTLCGDDIHIPSAMRRAPVYPSTQ